MWGPWGRNASTARMQRARPSVPVVWEDVWHKDEFGSLPLRLFPLHFGFLLYSFKTPIMVWPHLNASEMKSLMLTVLSDAEASFLFSSFSQNAVYEFLGRI